MWILGLKGLKVKKEIRVLFLMPLYWLELYRCFLNLEGHPSIKSILKEDYFSLTDLDWLPF